MTVCAVNSVKQDDVVVLVNAELSGFLHEENCCLE